MSKETVHLQEILDQSTGKPVYWRIQCNKKKLNIKFSGRFYSLKEAQTKKKELEAMIALGMQSIQSTKDLLIVDALDLYIASRETEPNLDADTYKYFKNKCNLLKTVFENINYVSDITPEKLLELRKYATTKKANPWSTDTFNRNMNTLSGMFNFLIKNNYYDQNHVKEAQKLYSLKFPKHQLAQPRDILVKNVTIIENDTEETISELELLKRVTTNAFLPLLLDLMLILPIRKAEVLKFTAENTDLANYKANIKSKNFRYTQSNRNIELFDEMAEILAQAKKISESQGEHFKYFNITKNGFESAFNYAKLKVKKQYNIVIPWTLHDLKHTAITNFCNRANVTLADLRAYSGNVDLEVLYNVYISRKENSLKSKFGNKFNE